MLTPNKYLFLQINLKLYTQVFKLTSNFLPYLVAQPSFGLA